MRQEGGLAEGGREMSEPREGEGTGEGGSREGLYAAFFIQP